MSVDGEEAGLTGSTYYTNHPLVPKDKVIAILNLEQVGVGQMLGANYHYKYPELAKLSQKPMLCMCIDVCSLMKLIS